MISERPVVVVGGGGHGRVVLDVLRAAGAQIMGVVDPSEEIEKRLPAGVVRLGGDGWLEAADAEAIALVNGIGSVNVPTLRRTVFERWSDRGFAFARVVHPAAIVAADAVLGDGCQIMAGAIVQPGARIGADAIVNTGASVDHDCDIGAHVHIAPGVTLSGGVVVGEASHIGTGAIVIQNVRIGAGALVGAGVVVTRDVAAGARVTLGNSPEVA